MLRILLFVGFSLTSATVAHAQCQFYVNASDGDDSNPGTQIRPLRSIETAFNTLPSDTTVCVASGEYFRGGDQDGILLGIAGKNMAFVLNEFAGSTEVRFSEGVFSVALGSGEVSFTAGTASKIVFGIGVSNANGIFPNQTNYLHSLEFKSGTVSFVGLSVEIEASVGNPTFQHPTNPLKLPKSEAAIVFGPSMVTGTIQYVPANRQIVFDGSASGEFRFPLPTDFDGSKLLFNHHYSLVFDDLTTFHPVLTPFTTTATFSGSVLFAGGVQITGSEVPDVLLENAGNGSIVISNIELLPVNGVPDKTTLVNSGSGVLEVRETTTVAGENGVSWPFGIENASGTLILGSTTAPMILNGSLVNSGLVQLKGNVILSTDALLFNTGLSNSGTISLGTHNFTITASAVSYSSEGGWQASTGRLFLEGTAVITGSGAFPATEVVSGSFTLATNTFSRSLSIRSQGMLTLTAAGNIVVQGNLTVDNGTMAFQTFSDLHVQGDVSISNSNSIVLALGSLIINGSLLEESSSVQISTEREVSIAGPLALNGGSLSISVDGGSSSTFLLKSQATISNGASFQITAALAVFESHLTTIGAWLDMSVSSKVSIYGNFLATQAANLSLGKVLLDLRGDFELNTALVTYGTSTLAFNGLSPQSIRTSIGISVPTVVVNANTLTIETDVTITGALEITQGNVTVFPSRFLNVNGLSMTSGVLSVNEGSTLRVDGDFETSSSTSLNFDTNTKLILAGNTQILSSSLTTQNLSLELSGTGELVVNIPSLNSLREFILSGSNNVFSFSGAPFVTLGARLLVESNTHLLLPKSWIELSGSMGDIDVLINGRISGAGGILFSGPVVQNIQPMLSGAGILGNMKVDFANPTTSLSLLPLDKLTLSGQLELQNGLFELNGGELDFSTINTTPALSVNLSNFSTTAKISDSAGIFRVNPSKIPYNLTYTGSLQQMYSVGPEFGYGPHVNLSIGTSDALNSPAVFGLLLNANTEISGNLILTTGARLRLDNANLVLPSNTGDHLIDGEIIGSGIVSILGESSISSPTASGSLTNLTVDAGAGRNVRLIDLAHAVSIRIQSGTVHLSVVVATSPFAISSEVIHTGGILRISRDVALGNSSESGRWQSTGGSVIGSSGNDVVLSSGSSFNLGLNSSWTLDSEGSGNTANSGFVVFSGSGQVAADSPLPRLRLAPFSANNNDIVLTSNVSVSDVLVTQGADILLGPHTFTLSSFSWSHEIDQLSEERPAGVIYGDFTGNGGSFVISGQTTVILGEELQLNFASLSVLSPSSSVVLIQSSNGLPHNIILANRPFEIGSAQLNLGINDLVLRGNTDPILIMKGGTIYGASTQESPPWLPSNLASMSDIYPFNDDLHGEVIIEGLSNSSIHASLPSVITNLTGNRSFRLSDSTSTVTISKRLIFGEGGAGISSSQENKLLLASGISLIRRGSGPLSFAPIFEGAVDVFYDLDDGTLSGHNSAFADGQLLSGQELPSSGHALTRFGVLAGQLGGIPNKVKLTKPIRIRDLLLFSGVLDGDLQSIIFSDSGRFSVIGADPVSAPSFISSLGYTTPSSISMRISSQFADIVTSDALFPPDALVSALFVSLGNATSATGKDLRLHASRSIGSLYLDHRHAGSRMRLNGNALTVTGNAVLHLGILSSDANSLFAVGGNLDIDADARISGVVETVVSGDIKLAGFFLSSSLQFEKNLIVSGTLTPLVSLLASGTSQTVEMISGNLGVASLTLDMQEPIGGGAARLSLANVQKAGQFKISSGLILKNGILDTGGNSLLLPLGSNPVSHYPAGINLSHVIGNVSYDLPERFIGDLLFPVGSADRYHSFILHMTNEVISSTRINVVFEDNTPFGKAGLPLQTVDGAFIQDTVPYSWLLTSSVNFGSSQKYGFSSVRPDTSYAHLEEMLFLTREATSYFSPWSNPIGAEMSGTTNEASYLRHDAAFVGLSQNGTRITIGTPSFQGEKSVIQIVDLFSATERDPIDVYFNEKLIIPNFGAGQNSPILSVDISLINSNINFLVFTTVGGSPSLDILGVGLVSKVAGTRTVYAIHPGPNFAFDLATSSSFLNEPSVSSSTGIIAFNGAISAQIVNIGTQPSWTSIATRLMPGVFAEPTIVSSVKNILGVVPIEQPEAIEHFSFDLTGTEGEILVLLVKGNSELDVSVVRENGSVLSGARVTAAEENHVMPSRFSLESNFPNPFSMTTNISLNMAKPGDVKIAIYDPIGRLVKKINAGILPAGAAQRVQINGSRMASGTYFYVVTVNSRTKMYYLRGKLLLVR